MNPPVYAHGEPMSFGGVRPVSPNYQHSRVVILPVPFDRTTSYVPGTRNGPREILQASTQMELWDEELSTDVHPVGIFTLPEMELPFGEVSACLTEIERVAGELFDARKFPAVLGGEHSITPAIVAAAVKRFAGLSVLQIDAHADLRESYMGSPFNHACAMRRVLEKARCTQVGIRSMSAEEASVVPDLPTRIFHDFDLRQEPNWIDRVVETLAGRVYITIDCDGLDPAIMPAVGTPEPGGLSWYEVLALLRATMERRDVIGCDVVELCPIPGMVAPNFLCARLIYKMLTYRFASR